MSVLTPLQRDLHAAVDGGSLQGLAAHKRLAHQIGAMEKHLIDGSACPSCLMYFWSRLHRTEALQPLAPRMQPMNSKTNELRWVQHQLEALEKEAFNFAIPDVAMSLKNAYWDRLTLVTAPLLLAFRESGFDASTISTLPDAWLDAAATADLLFGDWLESVNIEWGEHCLADIIGQFADGEAETLVDNAYADMIYEFPRMQTLTKIAFLRNKIKRLELDQHALFPRRAPKSGTANARERKHTSLTFPPLHASQEAWLEHVKQIRFDVASDCTTIPVTVEERTQVPVFLVVQLFRGRRRTTDIHACLDEMACAKGFKVQVLSLDTAVSVFYGNLQTGHDPWKYLMALCRAKRVSATICGAPCETFSEARHHCPDPNDESANTHWLRPLRSALRF